MNNANKLVTVVAAVSRNGVYGERGRIPWHLPGDLKHFKKITAGHTVIMGRKTWESLPSKRSLPDRCNIVVTNTIDYVAPGARVTCSLQQAIEGASTRKVFCIGGASIWYEAMAFANDAWITLVDADYMITPGFTNTAPDLVVPQNKWKSFRLKEIIKPVYRGKSCHGSSLYNRTSLPPYFEMHHWVRGG